MKAKTMNHDRCPICASEELADGLEAKGEISGSVVITGDGKVWLTVFLDDIAILAGISIFDREDGELSYRLVVEKLESAPGTHGSVSSDVLGVIDEAARMVEFSTEQEAVTELLRLVDALGLDIHAGTRRAVPLAIGCGWRSPKTTKNLIKEAIASQRETGGN